MPNESIDLPVGSYMANKCDRYWDYSTFMWHVHSHSNSASSLVTRAEDHPEVSTSIGQSQQSSPPSLSWVERKGNEARKLAVGGVCGWPPVGWASSCSHWGKREGSSQSRPGPLCWAGREAASRGQGAASCWHRLYPCLLDDWVLGLELEHEPWATPSLPSPLLLTWDILMELMNLSQFLLVMKWKKNVI